MASFERRQRRDGGTSWKAIVRVVDPKTRQRVLRKKTFRRKTDAKLWAEEMEQGIRGGIAPARDRKVSELLDGWLVACLDEIKGEKGRRARKLQIEWWRERVGHLAVSEISPAIVHEALLSRDCSNATRNRWKSALGAVYRYWMRRGELRRVDNPTAGLHWNEPKGRMRWLDEDERARLLQAVEDDPHLDLLVRLALTTGMRRGEIIGLSWRDVDFERQMIRIEDTKSGVPRSVAILPGVQERLEFWRASQDPPSPLVFPSHAGTPMFPKKRWNRAVEVAQLDDFRFHDLRHTFSSVLAMEGATLRELAETLGHQTLAMVKRYSHLRPDVVIESVRQRAAGLDDQASPPLAREQPSTPPSGESSPPMPVDPPGSFSYSTTSGSNAAGAVSYELGDPSSSTSAIVEWPMVRSVADGSAEVEENKRDSGRRG